MGIINPSEKPGFSVKTWDASPLWVEIQPIFGNKPLKNLVFRRDSPTHTVFSDIWNIFSILRGTIINVMPARFKRASRFANCLTLCAAPGFPLKTCGNDMFVRPRFSEMILSVQLKSKPDKKHPVINKVSTGANQEHGAGAVNVRNGSA